MLTTPDTVVLAHGIGGRQDLPIPFSYALWGGAVALAVSFAALGVLWREPRLRGGAAGRPVPAVVERVVDSVWFARALRLLGLVGLGYTAMAALFGPDRGDNPTLALVYVVLWVCVPLLSLVLGPVWAALNPLRTLHRLLALALRTRPEQGLLPLPERLGLWPAAVGLLAFTWLELVAPDRASTTTIVAFFAVYGAVHLFAAALYGSEWFTRGDAFEVYSGLAARFAPLGRRDDGRLVVRNPFDGLAGLAPAPGLVATVCVLLGSTAYDGFSNSPWWVGFSQDAAVDKVVLDTLALVLFVAAVVLSFSAACWLAGAFGRPAGETHGRLPVLLAHSVVPIALGYVVAHYFSLVVFEGQKLVIDLSDPLGTGADWFGTADGRVDYTAVSPAVIALVQVAGVVVGHVLGVVAAHDRAIALFPRGAALAGQVPMMVLMIGYTLGGLTLLFAG